MLKKYFLPVLLLAAAALPASAQYFKPFNAARTPYFAAADSVYSLRITSAIDNGVDSVFTFNRRVVPVPVGLPAPAGCNSIPSPQAARHPDNLFGAHMLKNSVDEYTFQFAAGQEFYLKPYEPTGSSWTFLQSPLITATMQSRTLGQVQGMPDSVLTIALSNGDEIKLSENYGLLSSRSFLSYLQPNANTAVLELERLPEAGLGTSISHAFRIFDYQPGDKFLHYHEDHSLSGMVCTEHWTTTEVLSRTNYADSIRYEIKTQTLTQTHGMPGAPMGFCSGTASSTLSAFDTTFFTVSAARYPHLQDLSREYAIRPVSTLTQAPNLGYHFSHYNNRIATSYNWMSQDTCGGTYYIMPDGEGLVRYAEGLGLVLTESNNWGYTKNELIAYIKGSETHGTWAPLVLASEEDAAAQALEVYPNPFSSEITIKLPTQLQAQQQTQIKLYDIQGKLVHNRQEFVQHAEQQLHVEAQNLPSGLYLLQLSQGDKSWHVKVRKE